MLAEIITIGDEILIGQVIDTNSAFIAKELNRIGISVYQVTSVQDNREHILNTLEVARNRVELIIITGGLGPTKDDITKRTLCEFFDDVLVENKNVLRQVEQLFAKYVSTPLLEVNRHQALVPSKAIVLQNPYGTAPGMWIEKDRVAYVSLPGVPFEMRNLMTTEVVPRIIKSFKRPHIIHKTLLTYGLGESALAEKIAAWEENLPTFIKLAYLPNLGKVRLRLTAKGVDREIIAKAIEDEYKKLYPLIGDYIFGTEEEETLEEVVAKLLTAKKKTLATAESCTGGKIAQQLTALSGASAYFKGSVVSYATETKIEVLNIPQELIEAHSVVSGPVAKAMAENVRKLLKTDFAVATTGNAGPTKGDSDVDIGTVFIAIASANGVFAEEFNMGNHREKIVQKAVNKGLELLQKEITKI